MKQLTTEQQEQALDLIERSIGENQVNYIQSAKTFLQSLKPKIYVGCIDHSDMVFLEHKENEYWNSDIREAINFYSIDEARAVLDSIEKDEDCRYFILTE
jgi:hypothetical protein